MKRDRSPEPEHSKLVEVAKQQRTCLDRTFEWALSLVGEAHAQSLRLQEVDWDVMNDYKSATDLRDFLCRVPLPLGAASKLAMRFFEEKEQLFLHNPRVEDEQELEIVGYPNVARSFASVEQKLGVASALHSLSIGSGAQHESNDSVMLTFIETLPMISQGDDGPVFSLAVNKLAAYFEHGCDRYLRWCSSGVEGTSVISKWQEAVLQKGVDWEARIVAMLKRKGLLLDIVEQLGTGSSVPSQVQLIREYALTLDGQVRPTFFVYGFQFFFPLDFYEQFGGDNKFVFGQCKPDFLMVTPEPTPTGVNLLITVIDAKASVNMKTSHIAQVVLYAIGIREVAKALPANSFPLILSSVGGVWLPIDGSPLEPTSFKTFDLNLSEPLVKQWLNSQVVPVLAKEAGLEQWVFNAGCEGCQYEKICHDETRKDRLIGCIPYVSHAQSKVLASIADISKPPYHLKDIEDMFGDQARRKQVKAALPITYEVVSNLLRVGEEIGNLGPVLRAANLDVGCRAILLQSPCFLLPERANEVVSIFCSLLPEADGQLSHWSINWQGGSFGGVIENSVGCRNIGEQLHGILQHVHRYNQKPQHNTGVQLYVWSERERQLLSSMLINELCEHPQSAIWQSNSLLVHDPAILRSSWLSDMLMGSELRSSTLQRDELLKLAKLLGAPDLETFQTFSVADLKARLTTLIQGFRQRVLCSPSIVALETVCRELFAFAKPGYVTIDDAMALLCDTTGDSLQLNNIFSHVSEGSGKVLELLQNRNIALKQLVSMVRSQAGPWLRGHLLPFQIKDGALQKPIFARMLFVKQHSALSEMYQLRHERNYNVGRYVELQYVSEHEVDSDHGKRVLHRFRILKGLEFLESRKSDFKLFQWLLIRSVAMQESAAIFFLDALYFDTHYGNLPHPIVESKANDIVVAELEELEVEGNIFLALIETRPSKALVFRLGDVFILRKRFVDFNLGKVSKRLRQLDMEQISDFERLIMNPEMFCGTEPALPELSTDGRDRLSKLHKRLGHLSFTKSQSRAFRHILQHPLTLLWGPPGTGKTRTLALTIVMLSTSLPRPFRVMCSAFTNAALDELERNIQSMTDLVNSVLHLHKLSLRVLRVDAENGVPSVASIGEDRVIVIGTVWQLSKLAAKLDGQFDVMVVDEASQMPPSDIALVVHKLRPRGRLIIAGDHLQLAPVLPGSENFPEPPVGTPDVTKSLLTCLLRESGTNRPLDTLVDNTSQGACVRVLCENFRMTSALCDFTETLYPSLHFECKQQNSLVLKTASGESGLRIAARVVPVESLQKSRGLITLRLQQTGEFRDAVSYDSELRFEAEVVVRLIKDLNDLYLVQNARTLRQSSPSFFVVTPHRAQRATITRAVQSMQNSNHTVFHVTVDTVERLQGQEADIVIFCFGFLSLERVESELDFLFDRHRINVALTRARFLACAIVSDCVASPPVAVMKTSQNQAGFSHLQRFIQNSVVHTIKVE